MDELQHWLADARYSQSLVEGSHKPMKQMPLPPLIWQGKDQFCSDLDWSPSAILSQPLGRYFVGRFIEEEHPSQLWSHTFYCTCYDLEMKETTNIQQALTTLYGLVVENKQDTLYPLLYTQLTSALNKSGVCFHSTLKSCVCCNETAQSNATKEQSKSKDSTLVRRTSVHDVLTSQFSQVSFSTFRPAPPQPPA